MERGGILGEKNPLFAIRKISASDLGSCAMRRLVSIPACRTPDCRTGTGRSHTEFSTARRTLVLKGMQANLYNAFILGWRLSGNHGMAAICTPKAV
jgi:hypothetical protein